MVLFNLVMLYSTQPMKDHMRSAALLLNFLVAVTKHLTLETYMGRSLFWLTVSGVQERHGRTVWRSTALTPWWQRGRAQRGSISVCQRRASRALPAAEHQLLTAHSAVNSNGFIYGQLQHPITQSPCQVSDFAA